jgi:hypothetical protein
MDKVMAVHADLHRILDIHTSTGNDLRRSVSHLGLPRSELLEWQSTRH